jgi:hypothetical protein
MEKYRRPVIKSSGNCVSGSASKGGGCGEKKISRGLSSFIAVALKIPAGVCKKWIMH